MKSLFLLLCITLFSSCSMLSGSSQDNSVFFDYKNVRYNLEENAGKFVVYRESGLKKGTNQFVVKRTVLPSDEDKSKILERSIAISTLGKLKNGLAILRPETSEFNVWFSGKKYSNRMKLDSKGKKLVVELDSPESQWTGSKSYEFPNPNSIYCFYSQLIECVAVTGFFSKAKESGFGQMNFYIIWDGFPYFHEQYLNLNQDVFAQAQLEFDEAKSDGQLKFSLSVDNQAIFYVLDKKLKLIKKFWVAQGMSMLESRN